MTCKVEYFSLQLQGTKDSNSQNHILKSLVFPTWVEAGYYLHITC